MSWVTTLYSMLIAASATIAVPFLLVGIWRRSAAHLFFVGFLAATIWFIAYDMVEMKTASIAEYAYTLRWYQLPMLLLTISIVGFVRLYFGTGRLWLGITACAVRLGCLIPNFMSPVSIHLKEITGLRHVVLWGDTLSTVNGVVNPWVHLTELSGLILAVFVIDASVSLWKRAKPSDRHRAVWVGGSIAFVSVMLQAQAALSRLKLIPDPYLASPVFFFVVVAMTVELGYEHFAAEEQARKTRDEISRLSRISLLGEMTAAIAHELNQPLAAIYNNASAARRFIDRGNVDIGTLRQILVDIDTEAHRANNVIRDIRNTVKKGVPLRTRINMNELIDHVGHILQPDARAHSCELNVSLPYDLPSVQGDPVQIQQVLVNLVGNAFEAMIDTPLSNRKVEIAAERNGNGMLCVSVRDHGVGISDEARERIFDKFFTTKEEGLGMGLAIVRSVIEAHGGKIDVENLAGAGARFYFVLPTSQT